MPFDEGERAWKIRLYNREGVSRGLLVMARYVRYLNGEEEFERYGEHSWRGRPRTSHFETLYRWDTGSQCKYLVLIHFDHEFTEKDWARELSDQDAAHWLLAEGYELPQDLKAFSPASPGVGREAASATLAPLSPALQEVWDLLKQRPYTAKELAQKVGAAPVSEDSMRKRISSIRSTGRVILHHGGWGYSREGAVPPTGPGAERESG